MFEVPRKSDRVVMVLLVLVALGCVVVMFFGQRGSGEGQGTEAERQGAEAVNQTAEVEGLRTGTDGDLPIFDPNTVDSVSLLRYGLGAVQIRSLMGYRRHGGKFETPLAVSKLYNWSDEDVDKVLAYMVIGDEFKKTFHYREQYENDRRAEGGYGRKPYESKVYDRSNASTKDGVRTEAYERKYATSNKFTSLTKVDINKADTTLLMCIPGVGKGIAGSIVRLREKLGGFYNVDQLADLEFVSPELYEWFEVDENVDLHLININKASFKTVNAHPYISYDQTRDLMNYRRMYGDIRDKDALANTRIFTKEELERLLPYIEF